MDREAGHRLPIAERQLRVRATEDRLQGNHECGHQGRWNEGNSGAEEVTSASSVAIDTGSTSWHAVTAMLSLVKAAVDIESRFSKWPKVCGISSQDN